MPRPGYRAAPQHPAAAAHTAPAGIPVQSMNTATRRRAGLALLNGQAQHRSTAPVQSTASGRAIQEYAAQRRYSMPAPPDTQNRSTGVVQQSKYQPGSIPEPAYAHYSRHSCASARPRTTHRHDPRSPAAEPCQRRPQRPASPRNPGGSRAASPPYSAGRR